MKTQINSSTRTSAIIGASTRPRTKQGVLTLTRCESTYVGRMDHGVEIFGAARSALPLMNGNLSCQDISEEISSPIQEIVELVELLDSANLLDTEFGKISVHSRFHSANVNRPSHFRDDSNDAAHQQVQSKILPELTFSTWQAGVRDGGVSLIASRRDAGIEIVGNSRIAVLLYGILLASGFSATQISIADSRAVADIDLCAGYLRPSDVGLPIREQLAEAAKGLSLFPTSLTSSTSLGDSPSMNGEIKTPRRRMAVAVGAIPAEKIQEWMSEGIPHLLVDVPDGPSLTIGPIVIPGKSPCSRCLAMCKEENDEAWSDISWHKVNTAIEEVPVSIAHLVAGILALSLQKFFDENSSDLIGASERIDYRDPRGSERRIFTRHPACGCNW